MNARIHNLRADHMSVWLVNFEQALAQLDADRDHTGRIAHDEAAHLYHLGLSVGTAAGVYIDNHKAPI